MFAASTCHQIDPSSNDKSQIMKQMLKSIQLHHINQELCIDMTMQALPENTFNIHLVIDSDCFQLIYAHVDLYTNNQFNYCAFKSTNGDIMCPVFKH